MKNRVVHTHSAATSAQSAAAPMPTANRISLYCFYRGNFKHFSSIFFFFKLLTFFFLASLTKALASVNLVLRSSIFLFFFFILFIFAVVGTHAGLYSPHPVVDGVVTIDTASLMFCLNQLPATAESLGPRLV